MLKSKYHLLVLLVTIYICTGTVRASAPEANKPEIVTCEQVIKKADCMSATDRVLDVVTDINELQKIIIGYMGFVQSQARRDARSYSGVLLSGLANTKLHFLHDSQHYLFSSVYGGFDIRDINAKNSHENIASSRSIKSNSEMGSIEHVTNLDNNCFATTALNKAFDIWGLTQVCGLERKQIVHMKKIDLASNLARLAYCKSKRLLFWGEMLSQSLLRVRSQYLNEWQNGNMQTEYTFTLLPSDHKVQADARLMALSVSPNGSYIAAAIDTTQDVRIYERETGEFLAKLPNGIYDVCAIMWCDNTTCIIGSQDHTILFWDLSDINSPQIVKNLSGHEPAKTEETGVLLKKYGFCTYDRHFDSSSYAVSVYYHICPERGVLVSGVGKVIKVWDLATGECISTIHYADASKITLSPNGEYVIGSKLGSATIYEVADPVCVKLLKQIENPANLVKK